MTRRSLAAALAVVLGGWACFASARCVAPERARIVRPDGAGAAPVETHWLYPSGGAPVGVVLRQTACGAVTISRRLAETPTRPYLVEVRVGQTTVYLDPCKDYIRQGTNLIDANQYIPRALSLWRSLVTSRAQIVMPGDRPAAEARCGKVPVPRAIFLKPEAPRKAEPAPGEPKSRPQTHDQVASAR